MLSDPLPEYLTNTRELVNQYPQVEELLLSMLRKFRGNPHLRGEVETRMLSSIEVLITSGLLDAKNMNQFVENLLKPGVTSLLLMSTLNWLALLATNELLAQEAFNNIIKDPYKYRPILIFVGSIIIQSLSILNIHNVSKLLDDQHNIIKIMLLRKLDENGELNETKYQEIIDMSNSQFEALIRMLLKKTILPEILSDNNIEIFLKLINNKIDNNGGSSAAIQPIINIFMQLQDNNILTSDNVQDIFSALISHANIESLGTTLVWLQEFLPNNQELFNKIIGVSNISDFLEALGHIQQELTEENVKLLLHAKNPRQLVMLWNNVDENILPDIDALVESQDIDEPTKHLYVSLEEHQKKLVLFLCAKALEQSQLDFDRLKTIIQQVATLSDSELLYLIIPNARGYLDDSKTNMQVIYQMLLSPLPSTSEFKSFFDSLIKRNIITTENKLGQVIFDRFIHQYSGDSNNIKPYNITILSKVVNLLSQLNLLGSASPLNDTNLEKLLANIEQTEIIYNILYILTTKQLINSSNAQAIFNHIIKLPDKNNFNEILESAQYFGIHLQPKILQLLFKVSDNEQQSDLFKMWTMFYSPSIQPLVTISTINSIDVTTKESFVSLTPEHQQLLLNICKQLMTIDMPVDFNMFAILVNTPQEHLKKLQNQLLNPDMCSSQAETFEPSANLQFVAIYNKAVHKKLYDLYKVALKLPADYAESSMNADEQAKANARRDQLRIAYSSKVAKDGWLEEAEANIREKLLIAIKNENQEEPNGISDFIDLHGVTTLAACAVDPNHELTKKMRELFISNEYPSPQIAWRAYDRGAVTVSTWPNLLTPNEECEHLTEREFAALAFLASQDDQLEVTQRNDIWQKFICYVSEIRRAHNGTNTGIDDPSCYPGTMSRLSQILNSYPAFVSLDDTEEEHRKKVILLIENSVKDYIDMKLQESLEGLTEQSDRKNLYNSIIFMKELFRENLDSTMLNLEPILASIIDMEYELSGIDSADVLSSSSKEEIMQKYLQMRAVFFRNLHDGLVAHVRYKLGEQHINVLPDELNYLIGDSLVNFIPSLMIDEQGNIIKIKKDSQDTEETLVTDDLPKPNESAKNSSNKLVAITEYWMPKLQLEIYEKLKNIITDKKLCIAIIDELFSGVRRSLLNSPSKELLISYLRSKDIEKIFRILVEEKHITEEVSQIINKEQIKKALASVYDNFEKENQTTKATEMPKRSNRLSISVKKQPPGKLQDRYKAYNQPLLRRKIGRSPH